MIKVAALFILFIMLAKAKDVGKCLVKGEDTPGSHCFAPGAHWQYDGTCIHSKTSRRCSVPDTRVFKFTLRFSVRQLRLYAGNQLPLVHLWIRGTGPGLSWHRPRKLVKSASGVGNWVIDVSYTSDSKGLLCSKDNHCTFNQRAMEFRVYQDEEGYQDMKGPNLLINLPVPLSMAGHPLFLTPTVSVYPWFSSTTVTPKELTVSSTLGVVKMTLIYPPSFEYNVRRRYPVVIMFGFSRISLQIAPLLENMFVKEASIQEAFVIVIHHNSTAPFCDFNPYPEGQDGEHVNLIWKCKREEDCSMCHFCWDPHAVAKCDKDMFIQSADRCLFRKKCGNGVMGEAWLDTIEKQVIPEVMWKTQNRLLIEFPKDRLTMIGFDGMGLLACHAAITRPFIYKNAACLSAPFHWPFKSLRKEMLFENTGIGRAMEDISSQFDFFPDRTGFYVDQNYYIDYGELDNIHFPVVDNDKLIDAFLTKLRTQFDVPVENVLKFKKLPGANNDYILHPEGGTEILNRVKLPLLFFLRADGGPNRNFPLLQEEISSTSSSDNASYIPYECIDVLLLDQKRIEQVKGVPVDIFAATIVLCVLVTILLTVVGLSIYEAIKDRSIKKVMEEEEEELLPSSDSE